MCCMEQFAEKLLEVLKAKPGLTKDRIAQGMNLENNEEFRDKLSAAYDTGLVHKMHDKYYPGSLKSY
jgi:hypothetical protein